MDQLALLFPQGASQAPSRTREVRDTRATTSDKDFAKTFDSTLKQAQKDEPRDKTEGTEKPEVSDKSENKVPSKSDEKVKTEESETDKTKTSVDDDQEGSDSEQSKAVATTTDPLVAILVPEALLGAQGPQSPQVSQVAQGAQGGDATAGTVQVSELMKIAPVDLNIKEITVIKGLPTNASVEGATKAGGGSFAQQIAAATEVSAGATAGVSQNPGQPQAPQAVDGQALAHTQAQTPQIIDNSAEKQTLVASAKGTALKVDDLKTSNAQETAQSSVQAEVPGSTVAKQTQQKSLSQNSEDFLETPDKEIEELAQPKKTEKTKEHFEIREAPHQVEAKAKVEVTQEVKESVATQVVHQVRDSYAKGRTELRIQLNPETLGGLTLKVTHQDGVVRANIVADSHQTKELLESQLSSLKNQFAEQGLRVERIEVVAKNPMGFESNLDQRQQSTPQQQHESQRRQASREVFSTSSTPAVEGETSDESASGSLDVKA